MLRCRDANVWSLATVIALLLTVGCGARSRSPAQVDDAGTRHPDAGASSTDGSARQHDADGSAGDAGAPGSDHAQHPGTHGDAGPVADAGGSNDAASPHALGPQSYPNPVQASESDTALLGTDADADGLRDDVAAFIDSLESNSNRRAALKSFARESSTMLLIASQSDATHAAAMSEAQRVGMTLGCLHDLYAGDSATATELLRQIRYALYDNAARLRAYNHASTLVSGGVLHATHGCDPELTGVTP